MEKKQLSEVDIAKPVVQWLKDFKWEVYQEVSPPRTSRCADIIAVQNNKLWVIEVKKSLSLSLLEQINYWKYKAHYISIAVPETKKHRYDRVRNYGMSLLKQNGIGCFTIKNYYSQLKVREDVKPLLHRKAKYKYILECLTEEHKTFAEAGNADGKQWTPFKQTCACMTEMVSKNPGISLKDLMINIKHHYASNDSARSSMKQWIESGIIDNLILKSKILDSKRTLLCVYLKE